MKREIKELISHSVVTTPTGDNCQPFNSYWQDEILFIHHDDQIARHKLNFHNYSSLLSLGCLLENVKIVAEDYGLEMKFNINPASPLQEVVVTFEEMRETSPSDLSSYLDLRCTDRRVFENGWDDKLVEKIYEISNNYNSSIKIIKDLPGNVLKHFIRSDEVFWKDQKVFFDTLKWVRFSEKKASIFKDGLSAKNLGLNSSQKILLWLAAKSRFFQKVFRYTGAPTVGKMLVKRQLRSAGGFMFFYADSFNPIEVIEAGRLAERAWLELTKAGFGVQPLTLGTLMPYLSRHIPMTSDFSVNINKIFVEGAEVMEHDLSLPIWGFRWGKVSMPLPEALRTQRRSSSKIL